ncbi:MAG: GH92 family glycosyl hydrolase [Bacteroidota bacterium]|nr:GH92 family glycosyl hydrolase [Bacteroidota bacterium]MDP3145533.1 GH92 family glycosyl hydrolase [Bacteroidota bacterium]
MRFLFVFFVAISLNIFSQNFSQYVNPFIGTGGHGHTFPGAVLPFGMVQLSPDTRIDGSWDGSSGYHYGDSIIYGFSHTHLSGTGVSDWGDILVMPTIGLPSCDNRIYSSKFNHKNEKAGAGFYEVKLDDDNIKAELTTTLRTGIHRYTFPKTKEANIILDLLHRDKTINSNITIIDSVTVGGFRMSEGWAKNQEVYFVMRFSKPFKKMEFTFKNTFKTHLNFKKKEKAQGAYFQFDLLDEAPLLIKVAISPVSVEGAIKNMEAEAMHWDFDRYKLDAENAWNKQLKKIEVTDSDKDKLTVFYTALYHCCIHPSLNMDVDNQYRGRDGQIYTAQGFTNYSVFSLWDTYRALHPLFTIIERKRTTDFINTFLVQYKTSGRLPVWELSSNETDCMIGFHSVSVIADAMVKGIKGFDSLLAYKAAVAAATYSSFGIPDFNKKGFLQIDDESESVSKTLEYGYDNWCVAQIAKKLNKKEDYTKYLKLSLAYKNLFDASTGFMRPRKNGNWLSPFYANEINNHFTEGNSWQYSFYVPHDVNGLVALHGGKQKFENKLDELFATQEKTRGREQSDVTGLIGQYAHGNEPSHHMAYLYNFVDKPQKTNERVQQICNDFYKNSPDGLIGNEDCGQMSAWYIFSAMGFYPVCPGSDQYILGKSIFEKVKINLENEKTFSITNEKINTEKINGFTLNKKNTKQSFITHSVLMAGGGMNYNYESDVTNSYGTGLNAPESKITGVSVVAAPIINSVSQVFKDSMEVSIFSIHPKTSKLYYTLDGKEPTNKSLVYSKPFFIKENCSVKAKSFSNTENSVITEGNFFKLKYNYDVTLISKPNAQYSADGSQPLIDGVYGDIDWRKGNWLGFQPQDFECIIDLKEQKEINYLSLNCLQDTRSWILFPTTVSYYGSLDNENYSLIGTVQNLISAEDYTNQIQKFEKKFETKFPLRYLKVVAKNFGELPDWHQGKGGEAFIFVDELEIR